MALPWFICTILCLVLISALQRILCSVFPFVVKFLSSYHISMGRLEGAGNKGPNKHQIYDMLVAAGVDLYGVGKVETVKKSKLVEIALCHGVNIYDPKDTNARRIIPASFGSASVKSGSASTAPAINKNKEPINKIIDESIGLDEISDAMDRPLNQEVLAALISDIDEYIPPKNDNIHPVIVNAHPDNSGKGKAPVVESSGEVNNKGKDPAGDGSGRNNKGKAPAIRKTYVGTPWCTDIGKLGYIQAGIRATNKAVQSVMGCIIGNELHEYLVTKEKSLSPEDKSPILFLGVNGMINLVNKFMETGYDMVSCRNFINEKYNHMSEVIFRATAKEVRDVTIFIECLTTLEKANGVKLTYPPLRNRRANVQPVAAPAAFNNCLFNLDMLSEEERAEFNNNNVQENVEADTRLTELNLFNCAGFPILSSREVELLGEQFYQALWRSKNLGILAPINLDTWISLAAISRDEIKSACADAQNFTRKIDKLDVKLPFDREMFDWKCTKGDGFFLGQKGHQARIEEKRNDFYIKKMWRSFCPYFKCNCANFDKDKGASCSDGILWFDHVIWFVMNNLERVWPGKTPKVRFVFFVQLLQGPLRKAVIAYISYLKVRDTLISMTLRYSDDSSANLKLEFGNNKMSELMEKTIRPRSFLINNNHDSPQRNHDGKRKSSSPTDTNSDFVMPPKIYKLPSPVVNATVDATVSLQIVEDSPEQVPATISAGSSRTAGLLQTKLPF